MNKVKINKIEVELMPAKVMLASKVLSSQIFCEVICKFNKNNNCSNFLPVIYLNKDNKFVCYTKEDE
jgi:hypothetical protein